jgi:hypothetical protein
MLYYFVSSRPCRHLSHERADRSTTRSLETVLEEGAGSGRRFEEFGSSFLKELQLLFAVSLLMVPQPLLAFGDRLLVRAIHRDVLLKDNEAVWLPRASEVVAIVSRVA